MNKSHLNSSLPPRAYLFIQLSPIPVLPPPPPHTHTQSSPRAEGGCCSLPSYSPLPDARADVDSGARRGGEGAVTPSYSVLDLVPGVEWVLLMGFLPTCIRGSLALPPTHSGVGADGFPPATLQGKSRSPSSPPLTRRDQRQVAFFSALQGRFPGLGNSSPSP